ncbi:carbohydrate ABC transporter permease [Eubacteriales bacterium OttesenSCG-928-A19]|nr:carbohydrate ABC transporter permease [Eubacteriales bacterium OttesenSCG-928-A19]
MSTTAKRVLCRAGQLFLFILLAFISLFPLLWAVASSLRSDVEIFEYMMPFQFHTLVPKVWTVEAYIKVFTEYQFARPILNTLITSITTIVFSCFVNSIAAFGFATFRFKGKNALYTIVLVSFMVPFEAIAIPLYSVVNQFKWVDTYQGLIVPTIADGLVLFLFVQFFRDMPISFYESARLDGAKWRTIFMRILLPLSKPVFVTAALMVFINQWNSFLWPLLVAHGRNMRLIQVALSDFQTERQTLWSCLYAASVISALIPVVLFLPFQKYYVQGITASGLKG